MKLWIVICFQIIFFQNPIESTVSGIMYLLCLIPCKIKCDCTSGRFLLCISGPQHHSGLNPLSWEKPHFSERHLWAWAVNQGVSWRIAFSCLAQPCPQAWQTSHSQGSQPPAGQGWDASPYCPLRGFCLGTSFWICIFLWQCQHCWPAWSFGAGPGASASDRQSRCSLGMRNGCHCV